MSTVVVTGAAGRLGRRVVGLLLEDTSVERVVAIDVKPMAEAGKVERRQVDVTVADLAPLLHGADAVVHLAVDGNTERHRTAQRTNVGGTRRLLAAASEAGVPHVVALSSAMVYGAWPNNPVPITEETPLRPNAELAFAVQRAQVEQLVADWVAGSDERTASVLRPCIALDERGENWVATALAAASGLTPSEDDAPKQFLHLDDLARAVDLARTRRLDGPYNVAPDGAVLGDTARALRGAAPRLRLPGWLAAWLARAGWRFAKGPIPPGLLPYTTQSWVVANDRMRAAGWSASYTNEEAYVAGTTARWWTLLSPKRKQELALAGAGVAVVGVAGATAVLLRLLIRSRRAKRMS
jgi:nucleoside-diphosphate-sugar epimerase